jgi:acyl-CoA reductase-like NAD-dependent aldehyde dehydrogenase
MWERSGFRNEMKMFIDGGWVDAQSGETFPVFNPATGERVDSVPKGGREDVRQAVDSARDAFLYSG